MNVWSFDIESNQAGRGIISSAFYVLHKLLENCGLITINNEK